MKINHYEDLKERVDTGPVQFGHDWPGVFIRGDHANYLALCISSVLSFVDDEKIQIADVIPMESVRHFQKVLESCRV